VELDRPVSRSRGDEHAALKRFRVCVIRNFPNFLGVRLESLYYRVRAELIQQELTVFSSQAEVLIAREDGHAQYVGLF
jgi:exopolysaccharide biosynthesis predicted pyruvyltransferase EpsI